jgi:hypothetical protein
MTVKLRIVRNGWCHCDWCHARMRSWELLMNRNANGLYTFTVQGWADGWASI